VLASLWDVDSLTTSDYMQPFYEALLASDSVGIAVERAAKVVEARRDAQHPYYWAAFVAFETTNLGQQVRGEEKHAAPIH